MNSMNERDIGPARLREFECLLRLCPCLHSRLTIGARPGYTESQKASPGLRSRGLCLSSAVRQLVVVGALHGALCAVAILATAARRHDGKPIEIPASRSGLLRHLRKVRDLPLVRWFRRGDQDYHSATVLLRLLLPTMRTLLAHGLGQGNTRWSIRQVPVSTR